MSKASYAPAFQLTRGNIVESIHYGSIAVVTADNRLLAWFGNPRTATFLRSTAKPFQALPFIERKGYEKFNLTQKEIAILCASHSGTDEHKTIIESIQAKAGISETDLLCGTHPPMHRQTVEDMNRRGETVTANRHNCSGKHTGMIAYARMRNLPYKISDRAYIDPHHPIQEEILKTFAAMCGTKPQHVFVGIDGCSAPNFAVPLRNAALGFARLCDPIQLSKKRQAACTVITQAMMNYPFMVGGPGSFDSELMRVTQGKMICKGGAEGYQGIGILPGKLFPGSPALGIAFKISDGDYRNQARSAVALEALKQLGALTDDELSQLQQFGPVFNLTNFRKLEVGIGSPVFNLQKAR